MGYLIKPNKFLTYQYTFDSSIVKTCGSVPIPLINLTPNGFNGEIFFPLSATLRNVNQTLPYDFGSQSHINIQSGGVQFFIWQLLLNNMPSDIYSYTSLYVQIQHNYGASNLTGNADSLKAAQSLYLTTYDYNDATTGDGQLIVTINGFKTIV